MKPTDEIWKMPATDFEKLQCCNWSDPHPLDNFTLGSFVLYAHLVRGIPVSNIAQLLYMEPATVNDFIYKEPIVFHYPPDPPVLAETNVYEAFLEATGQTQAFRYFTMGWNTKHGPA